MCNQFNYRGMKPFSLDDYVDATFELSELDKLPDDELFDKGFTSYIYAGATFLLLALNFRVKTTCPINASEDIIKLRVEYTVNIRCELIEHHSFLRWIDTFCSKGFGLEATCNAIYERIEEVIKPTNLKVIAKSHSNYAGYNEAVREKNWKDG